MCGSEVNLTWKGVVRQALQDLGGQGHLRQINEKVKGHPKTRVNPTWKDTIRRVVRQYAVFEPVPPERSGVYRLVEQPVVEPRPQKASGTSAVDHSIAQGMLLALGSLYGYETFAPAADRSSREFQGRPLVDFVSVTDCTSFCRNPTLRRVSQIDAIWLAEDNEGPYPVYAFEVEHSTKVRSGVDRLVEIPERYAVQLFVVAPGEEEQKIFRFLIQQNRFGKFRDRLNFRDYAQLDSLYNAAVEHGKELTAFGVRHRQA